MSKPATPECDKMIAASGKSQIIGSFLEWLGESGYIVGEPTGSHAYPYMPSSKNTEELLAEYFEIDLTKVDNEKRAVLDWFREIACRA